MVSAATLKERSITTSSSSSSSSPPTTTHTKRKVNELGDISNTPNKQQKQQYTPHRRHNNNNSSWKRRQRQLQQQQQSVNHTKYIDGNDVTTPKSTSLTTSTSDKPITRSNSRHQLLLQEMQNEEPEDEQQQERPLLKCKVNRQSHSSGNQENYTHRVEHRQTSPSPTDISSPPAMNQEEEYMLQEITKNSQYFDPSISNDLGNGHADQNQDQQSYQHRRCKSVTFRLPHDEEKGFENSPLLTPKNDDSDLEEEILARHKQQLHMQKEQDLASVYPSTPPESFQHDNDEEDGVETSPVEQVFSPQSQSQSQSQSIASEAKPEVQPQEQQSSDVLANNADYISLSSTLQLIQNQRDQIEQEIVQLSQLKTQINTSSREETIGFVTKLLQGGDQLGLPKPTPVVTCPYIQWEKYHPTLANVSHDLQMESNKSNKNDSPFKFVI
ncbi:hypothetical protein CANMA_001840 [Candida margitis]|uniref:uncharacterized protein n=1 Tax=Candida margitis TaxID=1775924 RepID=UPI002227FFBD|nr:uncharacterized protein CANMA_001840 [Candida margitis]KAI5969173.1 hypothetical protein CANMA_001840 [Candida margitis]